MFSGAQVSVYPMSDDFVDIILGAIKALDPWRELLRFKTDSLSTLIVGPPELLFPAMCDLLCAATRPDLHITMHATASRGCPGEPGDPICTPRTGHPRKESLAERIDACCDSVGKARPRGQPLEAQLSLYPLGLGHHMDEIYGCIQFLRASGIFNRSKNFCTALRGDAGPVFEALGQAFTQFGPETGHLAMDVTVSANSPTVVGSASESLPVL